MLVYQRINMLKKDPSKIVMHYDELFFDLFLGVTILLAERCLSGVISKTYVESAEPTDSEGVDLETPSFLGVREVQLQ
jgi:hypothetical protein